MRADDLTALWAHNWPNCPPLAAELKHAHRTRWTGFAHPADTAVDQANDLLDELFGGARVLLVTAHHTEDREPGTLPPGHHVEPVYWRTEAADADPETPAYAHLQVSEVDWARGRLDGLLAEVARGLWAGVMVAATDLSVVFHPFEGGADVLLPTVEARDAFHTRHHP